MLQTHSLISSLRGADLLRDETDVCVPLSLPSMKCTASSEPGVGLADLRGFVIEMPLRNTTEVSFWRTDLSLSSALALPSRGGWLCHCGCPLADSQPTVPSQGNRCPSSPPGMRRFISPHLSAWAALHASSTWGLHVLSQQRGLCPRAARKRS